jgi:hypothetical protein
MRFRVLSDSQASLRAPIIPSAQNAEGFNSAVIELVDVPSSAAGFERMGLNNDAGADTSRRCIADPSQCSTLVELNVGRLCRFSHARELSSFEEADSSQGDPANSRWRC